MAAERIISDKIPGKRQAPDPRHCVLPESRMVPHGKDHGEVRSIDRQDTQATADIKIFQADRIRLLCLLEQEPCDEKTADDEKKPHPQISVNSPEHRLKDRRKTRCR